MSGRGAVTVELVEGERRETLANLFQLYALAFWRHALEGRPRVRELSKTPAPALGDWDGPMSHFTR